MAQYGSDDIKIEVDASGGSLTDLSAYITTFNGLNIRAITEETTPFGSAWATHAAVGVKELDTFTLGGIYDDTASTGPDAVLNAPGATRTVQVTWGSTKTSSVECIIGRYTRTAVRKELVKFEVEMRPTGTVTEA